MDVSLSFFFWGGGGGNFGVNQNFFEMFKKGF